MVDLRPKDSSRESSSLHPRRRRVRSPSGSSCQTFSLFILPKTSGAPSLVEMLAAQRKSKVRWSDMMRQYAVVLNSFANLLGDDLPKFVKLSPGLLGALGGDLGLRNCLLKGLNTFGWGWGAWLGRLLIPHKAGTGSMVLMGSDNEIFFGLEKSKKYQINFKNYWKIPNMDSLCTTSIFHLLT